MNLRELLEYIYFPNVKYDNPKFNVFNWIATLHDIPIFRPFFMYFDNEMTTHFFHLRKRTEK
jgi:hypothetical protein